MADISNWSRLDNAAKIFPPTSNERETWVFRIACQLTESIAPDALQIALDRTIRQFPVYTSILRKGLFWYYFEESDMQPQVKEEQDPPCRPLYDAGQKKFLFEVTYYRNRINFEVYHALTDGTGAVQFLRTLVYHYLIEKHPGAFDDDIALPGDTATADEKEEDGFAKYYTNERVERLPKQQRAYQLRGPCYPNGRMGVIEGRVSARALLRHAKEQGATLTEYLTVLILLSIHDGMRARDAAKPVVVVIPVNLRNFFPSESTRNFFSVANVSHCFASQGTSFDELLANVQGQFKQLITEEAMQNRLNALYATEDNLLAKLVPLPIKDMGLRAAEALSGLENTVSFSNIGRIVMPQAMDAYIDSFDFFTSTKHMQMCLCSYQDVMTISFTTRLRSTIVQSGFFRRLSGMGMDVEIASNTVESGR